MKIAENLERCPGCAEVKSLDDFPKNARRKNGHGARCKVCHCAGVRARYAVNPEPHRAVLKRSFGISIETYDEMHDAQDGLCMICGSPETNTYRGIVRRLSVDHDHETGVNRDLLCFNCNAGLGVFHASAELLLAAAEYLKRHAA